MIAGANPQGENPNDHMPTMAEMCYILWGMISQDKNCPYPDQEAMTEAVDSTDLINNYDWIVSFFLGVDVSGQTSSSDSSDSESDSKSGQTSALTK